MSWGICFSIFSAEPKYLLKETDFLSQEFLISVFQQRSITWQWTLLTRVIEFYVLHLTENLLPGGNNTPQKSQVLHWWTKMSSRCSVTQLLRSPPPPFTSSSLRSFRFLLSFQGRYGTQPLSTRSRRTCTSPPYRQSWRLTSPFTSRPALLLECSWRTRASRTSSESSLAVSARCVYSMRRAIHTNYKQKQFSHNWETLA